jgi:hypothetical protein
MLVSPATLATAFPSIPT